MVVGDSGGMEIRTCSNYKNSPLQMNKFGKLIYGMVTIVNNILQTCNLL